MPGEPWRFPAPAPCLPLVIPKCGDFGSTSRQGNRERQILGSEGLEGRGKEQGRRLLAIVPPPSSLSLKEPSSGSPGHYHSLAFPPSRLERDRHKHRAEGHRKGARVLRLRLGTGYFIGSCLEKEISGEAAAGGLLDPILDAPHPPRYIHPSVRAGMMHGLSTSHVGPVG